MLFPTAKSLPPNPEPGLPDPASGVDHYRCLKIKEQKKLVDGTRVERFTRHQFVSVADQFGTRTLEVNQPRLLCAPASIDGAPIKNSAAHLMCYKVKPNPKTRIEDVQINNTFGAALPARVFLNITRPWPRESTAPGVEYRAHPGYVPSLFESSSPPPDRGETCGLVDSPSRLPP